MWAHELTHAFFVKLCGGRLVDFKVSRYGGHVITDKNNVLISLSPYFFPFYTVVVILLFTILGWGTDLSQHYPDMFFGLGFQWTWVLFLLIGVTWSFHIIFTVWMISKKQPDLKQNGTFFSLTLIYLINLLVISLFLILASPQFTFYDFAANWIDKLDLYAFRVKEALM